MTVIGFRKVGLALAAAVALGAGAASAATVVASESSSPFRFDTREGPRESAGAETLTYSALWSGDGNSVVTISQVCATPCTTNGALVAGLGGEGVWNWSAQYDGLYTLTHATVTDGVTGKVETATFVVSKLGYPLVQAGVKGYEGVYDGEGHGVTVSVTEPADGALVRYSVGDVPGEWSETAPLFTNACEATVWVGVSASNYVSVAYSAVVKVNKAANAWTAEPSIAGWTYGEAAGVPDLGGATFGTATVTYSAEPGNAGEYTATFTVADTDDYDGLSFEVPFTIARATFAEDDVVLADYAGAYDGLAHAIGVATNAIPGLVLRYLTPSSASTALPLFTNVTNATVFVEASAPNYETVTNSATVAIAPRDLSDAAVALDLPEGGYIADGTAKEPATSVACDGRPLVEGVDYEVVYTDNLEPGTATATVAFKGNYTGTARAAFMLAEPEPEPVARRVLWRTDDAFGLERAATYDGYLVDTNANGAVAGTICVKAGRPSSKTGVSRLTVTVRLAGQRQVTVRGKTVDGTFSKPVRGVALDLALGRHSLSGMFGEYLIDGSRYMFTAKDADSKARSAAALDRCRGKYAVAWRASDAEDAPFHTLAVEVKAGGRVKVRGALANGTLVSSRTRLLVGGLRQYVNTGSRLLVGKTECAVAVSWARRGASVGCVLWFGEDGTVECENIGDGASALVAPVGKGLAEGAALRIDQAAVAAAFPGIREDISFPGGVPAELKLKYAEKDGTFSGLFRVYVDNGRLVKPVTVRVRGVVLDGVGYGSAYVKNVGGWLVTVE
ncbi:MAG: hypothetical protein IJI73_00890 [Kiritimatiellae bacterium]|nr:hypothetical protein [Kiritimatiellia bacterium]